MQTALAAGEQPAIEESPELAPSAGTEAGAKPEAPETGEGGSATDLPGDGSADAEQNDLSQSEGGSATGQEGEEGGEEEAGGTPAALPEEWNELPEDVREQLFEMAREVAAGTTDFGTIKRGHKLIAQHQQKVEQLEQENAALKQQVAERQGNERPTDPSLKSVADVVKLEKGLKQLIRWCERNPEGGEMNGQTFSAEEVRDAKYKAQDRLDDELPELRTTLQAREEHAARFTQAQAAARTNVLQVFPELKNPESAEGQEVANLLSQAPFLKQMFVSPEIAAYTMHLGQKALKELAKKRGVTFGANGLPIAGPKGGSTTGHASHRPAVRTAVPAKRPAGGGTAAAPRAGSGPTVSSAKAQIEKDRSVGGLANLMKAANLG